MVDKDALVTIKWGCRTKVHYVAKGYKFTKMGDEFTVRVGDMTGREKVKVPFTCTICGRRSEALYSCITRAGGEYTCSPKCAAERSRRTLMNRYGVDCVAKVPEFRAKARATLQAHYGPGVTNPGQVEEVKAKIKQTMIDHHGVDCSFRRGPLRERAERTMVERYGVDSPMRSAALRAKAQATNLERYGVDHPMRSEEVKARQQATTRAHYGVDNPSLAEEVKTKRTQTFIDHFGVNTPLKAPEVRAKIDATCRERYGVTNPGQAEEVKAKIKATFQERYGVDSSLSLPEVHAKARATNLERRGVEYPMQSPAVRAKVAQTMFTDGTGPSSRAQRHLCTVLGGELNYPLGQLQIDCALVDQRIAVEYDGSGHDASVRFGKVTAEQFASAERRRDHALQDAGWRLVRLASSRDELPADDQLRALMHRVTAEWLPGRSWVRVDLDTGAVTGHDLAEQLDLDALRLFRPHGKANG